jgi:hypothetical protein
MIRADKADLIRNLFCGRGQTPSGKQKSLATTYSPTPFAAARSLLATFCLRSKQRERSSGSTISEARR